MAIDALLDNNIVIAILAEAHEHHKPSLALLAEPSGLSFAVAAHSYAEIYSTLTRRSERALFHFMAEEAWAALESIRAVTALVGLTPAQSFDMVRKFAQAGGVGVRLYDRMIGEVALVHGISTIVTWNTNPMKSLFPDLKIITPHELALIMD